MSKTLTKKLISTFIVMVMVLSALVVIYTDINAQTSAQPKLDTAVIANPQRANTNQVEAPTSLHSANLANVVIKAVHNATKDPTLPTGFPPANFSNPQASNSPKIPDTKPIVVNVNSSGVVNIPNGTWETILLNVTGYDAGTCYDYFNNFNVNNITVWLGVNPEAGSWAVTVNISEFASLFENHAQIYATWTNGWSSNVGLHQNFKGIQYNNYTLYFYPVPSGSPAPSYPNVVEPIKAGTNYVSIPSDTRAAYIQSIVIDGEFQYINNPSWEGYYFNINGTRAANQFIYPWINSGGIDLFSWRPVYPPYMLDHQWNIVNLTGMLGMIEGSNVTLQFLASNNSPGIGLNIGDLFLYTNPNVLGAKQLSYSYTDYPLATYTQTENGLVNENGNSYSVYDSYKTVNFAYSSMITTKTGYVTVSTSTLDYYINLQSLPNSVWQNLTQIESTLVKTSVQYNEIGQQGYEQSTTLIYWPLSFDYGATMTYLRANGSISYYDLNQSFLNVMQAYNVSEYYSSNINGQSLWSFTSTSDMIYGTNGEFSSILEMGPGYAIILNITSSYHQTNKVFTYQFIEQSSNYLEYTYWSHHLSGLEINSTGYYVQETMTNNSIASYTVIIPVNPQLLMKAD